MLDLNNREIRDGDIVAIRFGGSFIGKPDFYEVTLDSDDTLGIDLDTKIKRNLNIYSQSQKIVVNNLWNKE